MGKLTKPKVVRFLKEKDIYNEIDEFLIDEMLYNLELARQAKADLKKRGVVVPINTEQTLFNTNPSNNIYQASIKQALTICRKLGIDFRSRTELKINVDKEDDGFD